MFQRKRGLIRDQLFDMTIFKDELSQHFSEIQHVLDLILNNQESAPIFVLHKLVFSGCVSHVVRLVYLRSQLFGSFQLLAFLKRRSSNRLTST